MSDATIAFGAVLEYVETGTNVPIGELTNIGGIGLTADTIEVTSHDSTSRFREFLQGIRDGGEISIEGNHVPSDDGQAAMYTHFNGDGDGGGLEAMIITFPDASNWTFNAIVTNYQAGDAPYDGKLGFSATLKISGVPNFSTS